MKIIIIHDKMVAGIREGGVAGDEYCKGALYCINWGGTGFRKFIERDGDPVLSISLSDDEISWFQRFALWLLSR